MSRLTVDLKIGETLIIGDATVRLEKKSGQLARLVVSADPNTRIVGPHEKRTPNPARKSALHQS